MSGNETTFARHTRDAVGFLLDAYAVNGDARNTLGDHAERQAGLALDAAMTDEEMKLAETLQELIWEMEAR